MNNADAADACAFDMILRKLWLCVSIAYIISLANSGLKAQLNRIFVHNKHGTALAHNVHFVLRGFLVKKATMPLFRGTEAEAIDG